jgi:hypothetical protein
MGSCKFGLRQLIIVEYLGNKKSQTALLAGAVKRKGYTFFFFIYNFNIFCITTLVFRISKMNHEWLNNAECLTMYVVF